MNLKKKDGNVGKMGVILVALISMFILLMITVFSFADMEKKTDIDEVGRNYILRMESTGFLTNSDEGNMINDLKKLGVKNISTTGSTKSKVGYGKEVSLNISGKVEVTSYVFKDLFEIKKVDTPVNIKISKTSTAKH